ncbi:Sphingolipid long chain base-responsive protein LSP1 [Escovopsis weberi]|uniref:Sphingolipid long chain base-responsive protein LSP1 n=1 Tax=Escovopsis weberi TaxID=150374 RepID=A0A0M8MYH0_ESCWE|nr:Sphingolipid long chain base-responsive protein LSP1 [Escovopsis weberi]
MSRSSYDEGPLGCYQDARRPSNHQPSFFSNIPLQLRNKPLSIRPSKGGSRSAPSAKKNGGFSFSSLRGTVQPELARRLFRLIKSENSLIAAYETAGRERVSIATQLSEWGEQANDEAVSDISDKIGVILSEIGELEDTYAHLLDDSRAKLKTIRNTEKSVQPSRDGKNKIADEIQRIKYKEPDSSKVAVLEQELVRAEAENLVAEAQLSNVTRQKLKEAYELEFAATIERAEKQIILAKHGRRLLGLLDDNPIVPGDTPRVYEHGAQARQVLNDAEDDLRDWQPVQEFYLSSVEESPSTYKDKGKETADAEQTPSRANGHGNDEDGGDGGDGGGGAGGGSGAEAHMVKDAPTTAA